MRLDQELLHAVHEVVDLRHHQAPRDDGLEQVEGRGLAAGRLHVPERPLQQEAQLLPSWLHAHQRCSAHVRRPGAHPVLRLQQCF